MNYEQVLSFMYKSLPMYQRIGSAAYKSNLDNTLGLDKHLKHPHTDYKTIHIAGTNGKGSVSSSIASILYEAGYTVGLYTSPHILDYRERIRVNGEKISKEFVRDFICNNQDYISKIHPSFFEMSVALAFDYFRHQKVDIAIIEVGMGGRLDSTNIISPILSVITNIGSDHTQFLGENLEDIALEKAGIIKERTPVVIGETNIKTKEVFLRKALEQKAEISFADQYYKSSFVSGNANSGIFSVSRNGDTAKDYKFGLIGKYQEKNLATVLETVTQLNKLGLGISQENIETGLENLKENTHFLGRWQIIDTKPLSICDIAHNKEGLSEVLSQLKSIEHSRIHFVLGFVNDKNISEILKLFPKNASYYFTKPDIERAMPIDQLKSVADNLGLNGKTYKNLIQALEAAKSNSEINDIIYIGGSTFIVADLLTAISFEGKGK